MSPRSRLGMTRVSNAIPNISLPELTALVPPPSPNESAADGLLQLGDRSQGETMMGSRSHLPDRHPASASDAHQFPILPGLGSLCDSPQLHKQWQTAPWGSFIDREFPGKCHFPHSLSSAVLPHQRLTSTSPSPLWLPASPRTEADRPPEKAALPLPSSEGVGLIPAPSCTETRHSQALSSGPSCPYLCSWSGSVPPPDKESGQPQPPCSAQHRLQWQLQYRGINLGKANLVLGQRSSPTKESPTSQNAYSCLTNR